MLSPSLEDYLEEVYRLSLHGQPIRVSSIAECLGVSLPSVVKGLKRLHEQGYIVYRPYQQIELLDKGRRCGRFLVERNKILREFVRIIGADCDVREEAEAMEHYFSPSTISAIEKLVSFLKNNPDILKSFKRFQHQSNLDMNQNW